jgi:glycosyltransferase involved in cell wall biosynthesis
MILVALKDKLEKNIPTISIIDLLLSKNNSITIFCYSCSDSLYNYYKGKGVSFRFTYIKFGHGLVNKIINHLNFRIQYSKIQKNPDYSLDKIYFASIDTAFSLFNKSYKKRYVIHVRELYEKEKHFLKFINKASQYDCLFIFTDYLRLSIYKTKTHFKNSPLLFPNKTFSHPRSKIPLNLYKGDILETYSLLLNKKVYLYQGFVGQNRNFEIIAKALSVINDPRNFLVLIGSLTQGGLQYVEKLKTLYSNTIHLGHINYPDYLKITSLAHVGLISYDFISLNNIFCAPNKLYEYTGFGIPVIGNDIPCLKYSIENYEFGETYHENDLNSVVHIINKIDQNYGFYSKNARVFFDNFSFDDFYSNLSTFFNS